VGDRADTTAKRKPAALMGQRPWLPWVLAGALAPLVGGLILVSVLVARHHRATPIVEVEPIAPPVVVVPPPKVTPVDPGPAGRRLAIDAQPPAMVWLDGQKRGPTPLTADVSPGKRLLELRADGFRTFRKTIDVGDEDPRPIVAKLVARAGGRESDGAPPLDVAAVKPAPGESEAARESQRLKRGRPDPVEKPERVAQAPVEKPAAPADDDDLPIGRGFGYLSVSCEPWARVFLDGRDLGRTTPLHRFTAPVGRHTLELRAPAGTVREEVEIRKGEETTVEKNIQ
jgi:hypothetical protein